MKGFNFCSHACARWMSSSKAQQRAFFRGFHIFLVVTAFFYSHLSWSVTIPRYDPVLTSIKIPPGYTKMLVPKNQGRLMTTQPFAVTYPSAEQNMQFVAFWNPAIASGNILYVQTKDPNGQVIDWKVTGSPDAYSLTLTVYSLSSTFPAGFYIADNSMTAADETEFYRKVANKYKSWAINQKWATRKSSKMDAIATAAVAPDLSDATILDKIAPYVGPFKASGQNSLCWFTIWRIHSGTAYTRIDDGLPDYRQGNTSAASSFKLLSDNNCTPIPYMNALTWDSEIIHVDNPQTPKQVAMNEIWDNNQVARYSSSSMIKNKNNQVASLPSPTNLKYVCQSSSAWKSLFVGAARTLASNGWKGIYYDMAAQTVPQLCYDSSHGHAIADPLIWQNGIRDILKTLKEDPITKDMLVITEGNAEIYMDLVDAYIAYTDTGMTDNNDPLHLDKQVPLFREVYGEIARTIGWQVFPESNPQKTISDLTPAILKKAALKSADYGNQFYASPTFSGWGAEISFDIQNKLATDAAYSSLFNLIKSPPYKKLYERGAGAINWRVSGSPPAPVDVVDAETGTAAVQFGMTNRDAPDTNYQLEIGETKFSHMSWDMKMDGAYYYLVKVKATDASEYNLLYDQNARDFRETNGITLKVGLGVDTASGNWRTINRNLADDLYLATGRTLSEVVRVFVMGKGLVDNISLSNAPSVSESGTGVASWSMSAPGLVAKSVTDPVVASQVVQFTGVENRDKQQFFTRTINDGSRFDIAWDMKTSMPYYVSILVNADDGNSYRLLYDQNLRGFYQTAGTYVKIGLGADTTDGNWRSFRRNLADDLYQGAKVNITKVVSFNVYANASVDNLKLWGNGIRTSGR